MVLAGLGLNPAGVLLFRMHVPQSPLTSAWGLNPARVCHGFALLLTVSEMLFRQPVWGRSDYPLDLNPAEVSCFACGCNVLGFLCLWLHCWGFLCLWLHHFSVSLGRQNATLESFTGDGFGRFGLESCWGSSVSHACPTEPFDFRLRLESCQGLPWFCFAFNGFPDAVSAARLGTKWLPFGLESCWGFLVSLVVAMCWGFFVCGCTAGVFFACGCIIFLFL